MNSDNTMPVASFQVQPVAKVGQVTPGMVENAIRNFFLGKMASSSKLNIRYSMARIATDAGIIPGDRPIESVPWHTLNASAVTSLIDTWQARELSNDTISLNVQIIRGCARACFLAGLMPAEQFALLKEIKPPRGRNKRGRGRAVALRWRDLMFEECLKDERPQGIRDAAILGVFFGVGLRRAEVSRIQVEDVDIDAGEVRLKVKGGNTVTKYLSPLAVRHLHPWIEVRAKSLGYRGPLFCRILKNGKLVDKAVKPNGLYYLLEQRSKHAGLPFLVRPHDARRTVGTWALSEFGEIVAKEVLGHANLSTTAIYDMRGDKIAQDALSKIK
ncbi:MULTISPECIES: site-specific integrase [Ectopseudomonas]|jgi:site-specific recombinase XerC|uniref:Site-specific recombinase XerC n=2 Tax=Ectopseudomonas TaxID=3236654 RepID=A0A1G6Q7B9_9GAMM|nr:MULTISPECIES: site-specific integrase [Pseudomonas]ALN21709.1 hypothetical protein DW68_023800 [Pseudomonas mendocina S5.2]KER98224.1 hypothetical protein HN51_25935 [Pseudomonas mendocina]MBP3062119.1 tyrosine-type recombinase/integrase [Pseudomonas chengduensis]NNB75411.1 site-specific integrase [Pseudomonas chengduensis]OEO24336.1 hypothetical protein AX279_16830 [Pseudomonas sp. J237]